ncbi:MAG: DUF4142 domain-containing protein [Chitinophagaceae bacterium]
MKKIVLPLIFFSLTFGIGCKNEQKEDSTEVAEEKNEKKQDSTNTEKLEDDQEFVVKAASGGLMEVELGKIAAQNAASAKVKAFGQRMVKDHSKANDELKAIASAKNISIPATPGEDHQKHIDNLKAKKGAEFDKDYIDMMVNDHEEDIKNFEKEASDGKDAKIKAFAQSKVPILKQHLEMARSANNAFKH